MHLYISSVNPLIKLRKIYQKYYLRDYAAPSTIRSIKLMLEQFYNSTGHRNLAYICTLKESQIVLL